MMPDAGKEEFEMKIRPLLLSGAWLFSGVLLLLCAGTGFYVLMASAEPVTPPSTNDKTFLASKTTDTKALPAESDDEEGIPGVMPTGPSHDLSRPDNKFKAANIRLGREHVALPKLASPNLNPGKTGSDSEKNWGPEASNPVPYNEAGGTPEELNAQREAQRADREKRRYDSLNERIEKLEERMTKVKADNPNDEQLDRLQKSIERLQKRREDLKREMDGRPEPTVY